MPRRIWLALPQIFNRLSHSPNIRAILLTGAGDRAFTAGLDVQAASQGVITKSATDPARKATELRRHIYEFQDCITAVEKCEKRAFPPFLRHSPRILTAEA